MNVQSVSAVGFYGIGAKPSQKRIDAVDKGLEAVNAIVKDFKSYKARIETEIARLEENKKMTDDPQMKAYIDQEIAAKREKLSIAEAGKTAEYYMRLGTK